MFQEVKDKYHYFKQSAERVFGNEGYSFHRFMVFVTSKKGQRRILNFTGRSFRYVFRKMFGIKPDRTPDYNLWMKEYFPDSDKLNEYRKESQQFTYKPRISVILPVYNPPVAYLKKAIDSVIAQVYENWELCIADDCSTDPEVRPLLESYQKNDERIKVVFRSENGHISATSNSALEIATGEYVALLDHDDELSADALFQNVKLLNGDRDADLIYSDEDKIIEDSKHTDPHFKPDWCPDNFLSRNYIGHLVVIRKSLVDRVNGFRVGFEGSQDYDLLLRITELTDRIRHIPLVLYHWRMHEASTAVNESAKPYAFDAGIKALEEALERRKIKGKVSLIENLPGFYSIRYAIVHPGKVSVIIPTKNKPGLCEVVLQSIFDKTDYSDYEVILIDNNSDQQEFFDFVKRWEQKEPNRFRCIRDTGSFNFSRLMNLGVSKANGDYLLLLNNDTEVIHNDWMTAMVEQCQFETTGAVGVRLVFQNDTIQHAGVIIGLGGIAGHTFVGFDKDAPGYFYFLKSISNYSAVTAACVMVKKKHYLEVGQFDEELAVEFNDVDFCLKLVEKGYRNIYLPHVMLYHYESISRGHPHKTKKSYQQHLHDVNYFKTKWQKYIDHDPCYSPHLSLIFTDFRLRMKDKTRM